MVIGQLYASAALSPGGSDPDSCGSTVGLDVFETRKISCLSWESNTNSSVVEAVA